jgi:general secretion pathway protein D
MIIQGTDEVIAPAKPVKSPKALSKDVTFKFEQAPIRDVIQAVLGDLMGYSYIVHQSIAGAVTVSTAAPVPVDQALSLLEAVLQGNNVYMVMDNTGIFHIGTLEALRGVVPVPKRIEQPTLPPGAGTVIIPLKFIGAAEMAEILKPLARPESFVRTDTLRNMLIMAGSRNQIEGWLEIIRTFDIDLLKGMSVGVFPLQYISVKDIEEVMKAIESSTADTVSGGSSAPAPAGARPAAPAAPAQSAAAAAAAAATAAAGANNLVSATGSAALSKIPFLGAMRIIPLERLNSLLVITSRASSLEEMKRWLDRLDRPSSNDGTPRLFVYAVQNGTAQHLATILGTLLSTPGVPGGSSGVAPGLRSTSGMSSSMGGGVSFSAFPGSSNGFNNSFGSSSGFGGGIGTYGSGSGYSPLGTALTAGTRQGSDGVSVASVSPTVKIVADDLNNSVIVFAPASDYAKMEAVLRQLDVPATQVLIEATIAEVTLSGDLQYGLQWYFSDKARHGLNGAGQLNLSPSGTDPIGPAQGFSYSFTNPVSGIRAVLNALADRSLIRVISSPSLMVQDNYSASIAVGDQVPIQSGTIVTSVSAVTTAIQYKDTGVLLNVTPTVNSSDMVAMTINQSVIDVGADNGTLGPSFLQRQITSRVVVRSGEAIVLGGLIQDNTASGSSGVPLLSDIPILGALFGAKNGRDKRTELLVIITPRVVRTAQDSRFISGEMRDRMRGITDLFGERRNVLPPAIKDSIPERGAPGLLPVYSIKP